MRRKPEIITTFTDQFGDERTIHRGKNGLKVRRDTITPALALNRVVAPLVGSRIKTIRKQQGLTLAQLAIKCGMGSGDPKTRMYHIESAFNKEGMRLGTIYTIAAALDVGIDALMPSVAEVLALSDVREESVPNVLTIR